jgi:hypothetical protein
MLQLFQPQLLEHVLWETIQTLSVHEPGTKHFPLARHPAMRPKHPQPPEQKQNASVIKDSRTNTKPPVLDSEASSLH